MNNDLYVIGKELHDLSINSTRLSDSMDDICDRLDSISERADRLEIELAQLSAAIREVLQDAK